MNNYIKKLNFLKKIEKKLQILILKVLLINVYYGYMLLMNIRNYVLEN